MCNVVSQTPCLAHATKSVCKLLHAVHVAAGAAGHDHGHVWLCKQQARAPPAEAALAQMSNKQTLHAHLLQAWPPGQFPGTDGLGRTQQAEEACDTRSRQQKQLGQPGQHVQDAFCLPTCLRLTTRSSSSCRRPLCFCTRSNSFLDTWQARWCVLLVAADTWQQQCEPVEPSTALLWCSLWWCSVSHPPHLMADMLKVGQ